MNILVNSSYIKGGKVEISVDFNDVGCVDSYASSISQVRAARRNGDSETETIATDNVAIVADDARAAARKVMLNELRDAMRRKDWDTVAALNKRIVNKGMRTL